MNTARVYPETTPEPRETILYKLIKKLEMEGMYKVKLLNDSDIAHDAEKMLAALDKIICDGEKEFIEKIGRPMTFLEKRSIYG
jgi:hypothetical protein